MNKVSTADYSRKELAEVWLNQQLERNKGTQLGTTGMTNKRCEERLYDFQMKIVGYEWIDFHQFFYKKEAEDYIKYLNSLKDEGSLKQVEVTWNDDQIRVTVNNGVKND